MIVAEETVKERWKIKSVRRLTQMSVVALLIGVPFCSQNPDTWSPSLIVRGYWPAPTIFRITGDTWSFAIGNFHLMNPVAFVEVLLSAKEFQFGLFISTLIPLGITMIFGRVFCSWLCPVGFVLELTMRVNSILRRVGLTRKVRTGDYRYFVLVLSMLFAFFFAFPVISVLDPPHVLGRELIYFFTQSQVSLAGASLLASILLFEIFFSSRAWCKSFCPSGGALSLLGIKRLLRIKVNPKKCIKCRKCDSACPYSLSPGKLAECQYFDWTICDNCGLCIDICPNKAISYWCLKRK
ncbi:MAG: 4Fe-4S binding protein [Thermodesulfobacteriota bacterium]|nr:4Fe-4S binding protein [Thermodesulfobacteriota bacterium]